MAPNIYDHRRSMAILFVLIALPAILATDPLLSDSESRQTISPADVAGRVTVLERLSLPEGYHEGLLMRDGAIWVANGKAQATWKIDRKTGRRIGDIKVPGSFTEAFVDEGNGSVLFSDWVDKAIYRTRVEGDTLLVLSQISVAPEYPAGMALHRGEIWVITWSVRMNTVYFLYRFDRALKLLEKMPLDGIKGPAHMASDGRYLWITAWYGGLIHVYDPGSKETVAKYASPITDATGIAFEGDCLWITGTSSDLFRLKIER